MSKVNNLDNLEVKGEISEKVAKKLAYIMNIYTFTPQIQKSLKIAA
jgi:hypothetical protein